MHAAPLAPGPGGTLGIVAGNGTLPLEIAEAVQARGGRPFVVGIEGEAEDGIRRYDHRRLGWGHLGRLFRLLEAENARDVIFAGGVARRPRLGPRDLDLATTRVLPRLLVMLMSGDDTILSGLARMFEERGFTMRGVADVAPELLLDAGNAVGRPGAKAREQVAFGMEIVRALGRFDLGQAVVVCGRRAVAVEGVEGTDAMLRRVEELRDGGRLRDDRDGVLVKVPKPEQDRRVDLPAIGPATIVNARAAGLRGIGAEAGGLVLLERERTLELARRHGVFLHPVVS